MDQQTKTKKLFRLLIGAAWIDGVIQPEEREYLHTMACDHGIDHDPDILGLLTEAKPIKPEECYLWLEDYMGSDPTAEDYQDLIDGLSAIIYSDSNIETEEAKLLSRLQSLDPIHGKHPSFFGQVLNNIRHLYRQAMTDLAD